jgi:hypothetical protein
MKKAAQQRVHSIPRRARERLVGFTAHERRDGRPHPIRSWDRYGHSELLPRQIAPPKEVDSVLEHFPSRKIHTWNFLNSNFLLPELK